MPASIKNFLLLRVSKGKYDVTPRPIRRRRKKMCPMKTKQSLIVVGIATGVESEDLLKTIAQNMSNGFPAVRLHRIVSAETRNSTSHVTKHNTKAHVQPRTVHLGDSMRCTVFETKGSIRSTNTTLDERVSDRSQAHVQPRTVHLGDSMRCTVFETKGSIRSTNTTLDERVSDRSQAHVQPRTVHLGDSMRCTVFETKGSIRSTNTTLDERVSDQSPENQEFDENAVVVNYSSPCARKEKLHFHKREESEDHREANNTTCTIQNTDESDILNFTNEEKEYFRKLDCELYDTSDDSSTEDATNDVEPLAFEALRTENPNISSTSVYSALGAIRHEYHDKSTETNTSNSIGNLSLLGGHLIGSDMFLNNLESDDLLKEHGAFMEMEHSNADDEGDRCYDADYLPEAESESDHSEDDEVNENSDDSSNQPEAIPISSTPKLNSPAVNVEEFAGAVDVREIPDVPNAEVAKRYFCAFCNKRPIKYARHLITVHKDEEEVKEFAKLPAKSQERQELIAKLRHNHALIFNRSEMTKEKGLQVGRRPNKHSSQKSANSYVSCPNCFKFVVKLNLRHHYKICSHDKPTNCRGILAESRRIMGRMHKSANSVVKNCIFPFLRDDDITAEILYDELIILYANTLSEKYPTEEDHAMIRQKLRTIGRFLKVVKEINPEIKNFSNLFTAKNFDLCIEGVNKVAGISEDYCVFRSPTTATSIGTLLKKVGIFLETLYIKREENEKKKQVKDFLKLIEKGFEIINRRAAETLVRRKRLKANVLPSKDDIQKLTLYLEEKRMQAFEKLQKKFRYDYWLQLSEMTLLAIQVFNRRRQGEVSKMKIEDYRAYKRLDKKTDKDTYENLSEKCKTIAETYVRFEIRGKLGRTVGILMRDEILQSVEVILTFRNIAGVPDDNPYVFGLKPSNDKRHKRLYAYEIMRKHSGLCGAEIPESLRGTKLRKHIATLCAEYNLSDSELVDLANFLGHAAKIHQSHYRQQAARDIVGVSQFLEAASRKDIPGNTGISCHNAARATRQRDADGTLTSQTSQDTSAVPTDRDESLSSNIGDDCRPVVPVTNGIRQRNQRLHSLPASGSETDEDDPPEKKKRPCRRVAPAESGSDENEPPSKKRRLCRRIAWNSSEIDLIKKNFGRELSKMTYPSKTQIEALIAAHEDVLGRRHYKHIKAWMSNQYKLMKPK